MNNGGDQTVSRCQVRGPMSDPPCAFVIASFVVACCARVPRMPTAGESAAALSVLVEPGGKGFNVALGLHRLGIAVAGILATGNDAFGDMATKALSDFGLPGIRVLEKDGSTGTGVGISDEAGDNRVAIGLGANLLLAKEDMARGLYGASLVIGQFETCDEVLIEAFSMARSSGVETVLNPSPFRAISGRLLGLVSTLIVNEVEAEQFGRQSGLDVGNGAEGYGALADVVLSSGPGTLIVTCGDRGLIAFRRSHPPCRVPAFSVPCVDPLGAGDAFTAAFCASLLRGEDFEDCLRAGSASGAFCVQRHGVIQGLPTTADLSTLLDQHKAQVRRR
ncbi:ribokinase [Terrihabitans sp. PJ23]|uniref:Ribokinase n=2 Tax=Terrihabitans rhizophilus TaxID=3092662 RepID=A0ABU4RN34_9HYPH|nr:ribokinase [Terrihabitans sp. PJ23]